MNCSKIAVLSFAYVVAIAGVRAEEDVFVYAVTTLGSGRYEKNTNWLLFSSGRSYDAEIPQSVKAGDDIVVTYRVDGVAKMDEFSVVGISSRGDLCRLHNRIPHRYSTFVGDMVYVQPCRVTQKR